MVKTFFSGNCRPKCLSSLNRGFHEKNFISQQGWLTTLATIFLLTIFRESPSVNFSCSESWWWGAISSSSWSILLSLKSFNFNVFKYLFTLKLSAISILLMGTKCSSIVFQGERLSVGQCYREYNNKHHRFKWIIFVAW